MARKLKMLEALALSSALLFGGCATVKPNYDSPQIKEDSSSQSLNQPVSEKEKLSLSDFFHYHEPTTADWVLFAASLIATGLDIYSTHKGLESGLSESNRILGFKPTDGELIYHSLLTTFVEVFAGEALSVLPYGRSSVYALNTTARTLAALGNFSLMSTAHNYSSDN